MKFAENPWLKKWDDSANFWHVQDIPECMNTKPIVKEIGVKCPKCGNEIIQKKSRRGKVFMVVADILTVTSPIGTNRREKAA